MLKAPLGSKRAGRNALSQPHLWLAFGALSALASGRAYAQAAHSGNEVIDDPELANTTSSSPSPSNGSVIDDPELANANSSNTNSSGFGSSSANTPTSEVHLTLNIRGNHDLQQDDPREEVWESTGLLMIDATLRRSESLRFGLGITGRYHFASLAGDLPDVKAARYELDAVPTAGYVDASLGGGLHVRAGYQPVPLGRFDIFSAINVLSVSDLRDGPSTIPGRPEVGQIALMTDYDPTSWLSIHAVYVPFFMPHIVSVVDSDYALFPGNQANMDAAFRAIDGLFATTEELQMQLKDIARSGRDRIAISTLSAFTPEPRLDRPQGALRLTTHGTFGELAFSAVTALEHLPVVRLSDRAIANLSNPDNSDANGDDPRPLSIDYPRFAVFSADAAIDVPPFQLGFELAYHLHRALYAVGTAWENDPYAVPVPGFTDMAQAGGRLEYAEGSTWLVALEGFVQAALSVPDDPRRGWMFLESGRFLRGLAGAFQYSSDFGLTLQLAAAWFSGPSVILSPRISYDILSDLTIEAGLFFIDGQRPPLFATPILSLGGAYNSVSHAFVGIRGAL